MEERNDLFIQVGRINMENFMHSFPVLMVGCGMRSKMDHLGYGKSIQVSVVNHNARHYNMDPEGVGWVLGVRTPGKITKLPI